MSVRLSIHLSVTSRTCTKTVKCRITQTTPYDSPDTLVLWRKRSLRNSDAIIPNGVLKVFFSSSNGPEVSGTVDIPPKICVHPQHGGPRPRRCAGGRIRDVVNNVGDGQSLLITVTSQLTSQCWLSWKSVYYTYGSLQRYVYVIRSIACSLFYS